MGFRNSLSEDLRLRILVARFSIRYASSYLATTSDFDWSLDTYRAPRVVTAHLTSPELSLTSQTPRTLEPALNRMSTVLVHMIRPGAGGTPSRNAHCRLHPATEAHLPRTRSPESFRMRPSCSECTVQIQMA